jgi:hypothetical protein
MLAAESGGLAEPGFGQHFPRLVLSLEDVPGPVPGVLYKVDGREQQVRVFSAGPDLAEGLGWRDEPPSLVQ